jgi:GTP-binding protein Era
MLHSHDTMQKCGTIAIIGEPNAGKSTLTNNIVGAKVSIISKKVQTTRVSTLGIAIYKNTQIILQDTPGIFEAKKTIEKSLVKNAWHTVHEVDIILLIIDVSKKNIDSSLDILKKIPKNKKNIIVFNKIDLALDINKENFQEKIKNKIENDDINFFWISALKNNGVEDLLIALEQLLPVHPWLYPDDIITTQPEALWICEFTREQVYAQLHQEIPYEIYIEHESYERFNDGSLKISQAIVVAKESQKSFVIGKGGERIKEIGQKTRLALEKEMATRVHLKLFVKVKENWMEKSSIRKDLGL